MVSTHNRHGVQIHALIDTGSDWNCIGPKHLPLLGIKTKDLKPPTKAMCKPTTASGDYIKPIGYSQGDVSFGQQSATKNFICFENVHKPILSIDTLEELGISRNKSPSSR